MVTMRLYTFISVVLFSGAASKGNQNNYDTIVVGMGAAGTVAASTLASAGKKVLALEAQDRVGGRVYTAPFGDGVVEIGAEWIFGQHPSLIYDTAINNNMTVLHQGVELAIFESNGESANSVITELVNQGLSYDDDDVSTSESVGHYITRKLTDYMKNNTPNEFKDKDLVIQIFNLLNLLIDCAESTNDWNDINIVDAFEPLDGDQYLSWHSYGYKTFFELILNQYNGGPGLPSLEIKLNTEVTKIEWPQEADGKVSVTTKNGAIYKADNVIVTISLGVLKENYKTLFSTPLPQEKVTAIEKLQMGTIGKIILSFPNAWWPSKDKMYGFLWRAEDIKKVNAEDKWLTKILGASSPMGSSNTLTVWTSGDIAKQVETMPADVVKTKIIGLLRQFMGGNMTIPEPTGMLRSKWFSNEFTRGTYSYESMIAADYPTARTDLAAPLKDSANKCRVLFAGEASNPTHYSTVHGAAETGHKEAMRLLENQ